MLPRGERETQDTNEAPHGPRWVVARSMVLKEIKGGIEN